MNHTKEPWETLAHNGRTIIGNGDIVCNMSDLPNIELERANARRIVACVNACAGLTTLLLENAAPDGVGRAFEKFDALKQQRDALAEACRAACRYDNSIAGRGARGEVDLRVDGSGVAEGADLDALYLDWINKARAALAKLSLPTKGANGEKRFQH